MTEWRFQNMGRAIVQREVEIQRLRVQLARLEWAAVDYEHGNEVACPACAGWKATGHERGCWLAAELRAGS